LNSGDGSTTPNGEAQILRTLETIVLTRQCIELRGKKVNSKYWFSGFYDCEHLEKMASDVYTTEHTYQVVGLYVTLNSTNPALLSRCSNKISMFVKEGDLTSDKDITNWDYLPIDIDPIRPTGISSTNDELALAKNIADGVVAFLSTRGFKYPVIACSGNGWHLLYKIDMPNIPENSDIVKKILYALAKRFSTDKAGVDISNNNPSRIFKLYGTMARKGDDTPDRPHRMSCIKSVPESFDVTPKETLLKFIDDFPISNIETKGKRKVSQRVKDPKDVDARHPEFLKIVGKMVNSNFTDEAILDACKAQNKQFPEPKPIDVLTPEVEKIIGYCRKRALEDQSLPIYIYREIDEETGEETGFKLDYIKYSDFLSETYGTVYFNKKIYIYDEDRHIYKPSTNEIETHIRNTVVEFGIPALLTKVIPEILKHLMSMGSYDEYPFNCSNDTLPVINGILKFHKERITLKPDYNALSYIGSSFKMIRTPRHRINLRDCIELLPHGKEHRFTYTINVVYDPSASDFDVEKIFRQWIPDSKNITKLFQAPAQALVQMQTRHSFKKAYIIQGDTNSGKTSYFKLLIKIFSPEFIATASLQDLCEDRFVGGELEGKILNIRDDLQAIPLKSCEQFKELTGDCSIGVERKYETKYRGWATATMMFSCNYPPACGEQVKKDGAFWGRMEYVKFPNSFNTNTKFYETTYTPKFLSATFNIILETMMKIYETGQLLEIAEPGEVLMNWSTDADPICNFIEDTFYEDVGVYNYSKIKMFNEYKKWFATSGADMSRMITSERAFTIALQPYFAVEEYRLPNNEGKRKERVRVYRSSKKILSDVKIDLTPEPEQTKVTSEPATESALS
jgi:phage/plasmid-associated DNA primase